MEIDFSNKLLIIVQGPTASGKTGLSIELAKHFKTSILSADSRQFYREIAIGTAKPSLEERQGITHYLMDSHDLTDEVTAAQFAKEALQIMQKEYQSKDVLVLTGGSGMFVDALVFGLDELPTDVNVKASLEKTYSENGLEILLAELREWDADFFEIVDKNNPVRIIRALEVIRITGKKFSEQRAGFKNQFSGKIIRLAIDWKREDLYERINQRVDQMIDQGLLEEVKSVMHLRNLKSLNTVGYKEVFAYLDGEYDWKTCVEKIKQHTRNYAKRQLTWLNRYQDLKLLSPYSGQTIFEQALGNVENSINFVE